MTSRAGRRFFGWRTAAEKKGGQGCAKADQRRGEKCPVEGADFEAFDQVDIARVVERDQAGLGIEAGQPASGKKGDTDEGPKEPSDGEERRSDRSFAF